MLSVAIMSIESFTSDKETYLILSTISIAEISETFYQIHKYDFRMFKSLTVQQCGTRQKELFSPAIVIVHYNMDEIKMCQFFINNPSFENNVIHILYTGASTNSF